MKGGEGRDPRRLKLKADAVTTTGEVHDQRHWRSRRQRASQVDEHSKRAMRMKMK